MDPLRAGIQTALSRLAADYGPRLPSIEVIQLAIDGWGWTLRLEDGREVQIRPGFNLLDLPPEMRLGSELLEIWDDFRNPNLLTVIQTLHTRQRERWRDETFADPEIGRGRTREVTSRVHDFIAHTVQGPERAEFMEFIEASGAGDNPAFLRFMNRAALAREGSHSRLMDVAERSVWPPLLFGADEICPELSLARAVTTNQIRTSLPAATWRQVDRIAPLEPPLTATGMAAIHDRMMQAMLYGTAVMHFGYDDAANDDIAEARGRELMLSWLSEEQRAEFERMGFFHVIGGATGKRYRIRYGAAQNVHEIDDLGIVGVGLCFAPSGDLVPGDVMLGQKIALEANEFEALRVANPFGSNRALVDQWQRWRVQNVGDLRVPQQPWPREIYTCRGVPISRADYVDYFDTRLF